MFRLRSEAPMMVPRWIEAHVEGVVSREGAGDTQVTMICVVFE